jgi:hypothetical protein
MLNISTNGMDLWSLKVDKKLKITEEALEIRNYVAADHIFKRKFCYRLHKIKAVDPTSKVYMATWLELLTAQN